MKRHGILLAAVAVVVLLATLAVLRVRRNLELARMQKLLNQQVVFRSPPIEISLPRFVANTNATTQLLQPGSDLGLWTVVARKSKKDTSEIRLTQQGDQLFSAVGNRIVATFNAGDRKVTQVLDFKRISNTGRIRFRYVWTKLNPGVELLGSGTPFLGRQYQGEALLQREQKTWKVLYWTTPFERALAQFQHLITIPDAPTRPVKPSR